MNVGDDDALFTQLRDDYRAGIVTDYDPPPTCSRPSEAFALMAKFGGADVVGDITDAGRRHLLEGLSQIDQRCLTRAVAEPRRGCLGRGASARAAVACPCCSVVWQLLAMVFPAGCSPRPSPSALQLWHSPPTGRLLADLGKTLARAAIAFVIAMAVGTAIGIVLGRIRLRRPAVLDLGGGRAQPAGHRHRHRALHLAGPDRVRADPRGGAQQDAAGHHHHPRGRAQLRRATTTNWPAPSACRSGGGCG